VRTASLEELDQPAGDL